MDRQRIGALIRARREALRLTVRAAADLTDGEAPYSTWSQIETGRLNWSADKLASTLYALGVHLEVSAGASLHPLRPRHPRPDEGVADQQQGPRDPTNRYRGLTAVTPSPHGPAFSPNCDLAHRFVGLPVW
jgi:transcriptional regulator with XRE-family HTH domain